MTYELVLIGTAVHILIWEKLPEWGSWFNTLLQMLPRPLQILYEQWRCAYCAGFWIALVLHALTGFWTIPALAHLPGNLGVISLPVGWTLDALASATLIYFAVLSIRAIGWPAMQAHLMRKDFMATAFAEEKTAERSSK